MQDKELEKFLQEKADQTKIRDFSEVWNEIKDQIVEPKRKSKRNFKKWLPMVLASAAVVVCLIISPIVINSLKPAPEEVYYADGLITQNVMQVDMLDGLSQGSISHVDFAKYTLDGCKLLITEDNIVKGANFVMYSEIAFATVKLYDKTVDLKLELEKLYDSTCKINTANVHYKFKRENNGMFEYDVYAVHNNVQYVMQYTGLSNNLMEFLNNFFA